LIRFWASTIENDKELVEERIMEAINEIDSST